MGSNSGSREAKDRPKEIQRWGESRSTEEKAARGACSSQASCGSRPRQARPSSGAHQLDVALLSLLLPLGHRLFDLGLGPDHDDRDGRVRDAVPRDRAHSWCTQHGAPCGKFSTRAFGSDDERVRTIERDQTHLGRIGQEGRRGVSPYVHATSTWASLSDAGTGVSLPAQFVSSPVWVESTHDRVCNLSGDKLDDDRDVSSVDFVVLLEDVALKLAGLVPELVLLGQRRTLCSSTQTTTRQTHNQFHKPVSSDPSGDV